MEKIKKGKGLTKIDKRYTIRFSYAGISQYADFYESKGKLINPYLPVSYMNISEIPDVSKMETIDDVLKVIKSFAYGSNAEIHLINGNPPFYKPGTVDSIASAYDTFITDQISTFFKKELEPIMREKGWRIGTSHIGMMVLIGKDENGEWNNVSDDESFEFEYLCAKCLKALNLINGIELKSEHRNYISESPTIFAGLNNEILKSDIFIEV